MPRRSLAPLIVAVLIAATAGCASTGRVQQQLEAQMKLGDYPTAIQTVDNRTVVFVPGDEDGEFAAHPVTVGRESNRQAEVLEGLEPGDRVVVEGAFVLKSELMRGELGHGHAH